MTAAPRGGERARGGLFGVSLRPGERAIFAWAFLCSACVLGAWYAIKPLREVFGTESGSSTLSWLFTGTFAAMVAVVPLYSSLVAKHAPRAFVPAVYHFFAANLVVFWIVLALQPDDVRDVAVGRVYFVWTSVFALFVPSVFWALMVDLLREEQCKRLFGALAAGGTLGGLAMSGLVGLLAGTVSPLHALLLSALLLELAVLCVRRIVRHAADEHAPRRPAGPEVTAAARVGGSVWAGFASVARSPYLLGICAYMLLATYAGTIVYNAKIAVVEVALQDRGERTQLFAAANFAIQSLTVLVQAFLASRAIRVLGVGATLAVLPLLSLLGLLLFGLWPTLAAILAVDVLRSATSYGLAKPTKEVLWSVVPREEKYKAKSFVDLVVYRGGDSLAAWSFAGLRGGLGLSLGVVAWLTIPLCLAWSGLALVLGRREHALAEAQRGAADSSPSGASSRESSGAPSV